MHTPQCFAHLRTAIVTRREGRKPDSAPAAYLPVEAIFWQCPLLCGWILRSLGVLKEWPKGERKRRGAWNWFKHVFKCYENIHMHIHIPIHVHVHIHNYTYTYHILYTSYLIILIWFSGFESGTPEMQINYAPLLSGVCVCVFAAQGLKGPTSKHKRQSVCVFCGIAWPLQLWLFRHPKQLKKQANVLEETC